MWQAGGGDKQHALLSATQSIDGEKDSKVPFCSIGKFKYCNTPIFTRQIGDKASARKPFCLYRVKLNIVFQIASAFVFTIAQKSFSVLKISIWDRLQTIE